jgi:four helix bundle protein
MKKYDLEDRFIDYAIQVSDVAESFNNSRLGVQISNHLIRSGSSPALNYGEAQGAESRRDFIHKLKIIHKELKESRICLKIALRKPHSINTKEMEDVLNETTSLIKKLIVL